MLTQFSGIFPYLVSPVDNHTGRVLEHPLRKLVEHLIGCGVQGSAPSIARVSLPIYPLSSGRISCALCLIRRREESL